MYFCQTFRMRADRLLSLVLLLRNRGRMSASALARELEVSPRTVLRDIDALSTAGIPVYAERGRDGGFELLPGFTTDLTGLTVDEAKALLAAGSAMTSESLGMAPAFASAMRKVVAAMPDAHRAAATKVAERVFVTQGSWLTDPEPVDDHLGLIQQAVFVGRRLSILYPSRGNDAVWRVIDPQGLIHAAGRWYLVATDAGRDRTYRLERIEDVRELDEPAQRSADIDLAAIWERRRSEFRARGTPVVADVLVRRERRDDLVERAYAVRSEQSVDDDRVRLEVVFGDDSHARGVLWAFGEDAEVLAPDALRAALRSRALRMAARYE
ncbi:putative DNA-binding transcriptional regulator YafY [Rhodococcus opacus]|jgi:predicted DNA-binding transcriptional regulator YafY|nr:putative DNA-binding transcriptional regulator YafY [Rhodococcus opacus]